MRILIVDDSALFRRMLRRLLETVGYQVVGEAQDGNEAIQLVREQQPDVVLLDVEMPDMDGIETARQIQKVRLTCVVFLTAYDTEDLLAGARDTGGMAYLVKPVDGQTLRRTLTLARARFEDWIALRRANKELAQRNAELKEALETIRTLRGLLPICAWCGRKIQQEDGTWVELESYVEAHTEVEFTHGICPDCLARLHRREEDPTNH
ncbi:MAG TPA: response regulator [Chloroflexi bacterium]|nr:response regulator [Chloroflexota bacterium]